MSQEDPYIADAHIQGIFIGFALGVVVATLIAVMLV